MCRRLAERRNDARNFLHDPGPHPKDQPKTTALARDIGLFFGPLGAGGAPATSARIGFSKLAMVTVRRGHRDLHVQQDGRAMPDVPPRRAGPTHDQSWALLTKGRHAPASAACPIPRSIGVDDLHPSAAVAGLTTRQLARS
jgi:hypothetical protein